MVYYLVTNQVDAKLIMKRKKIQKKQKFRSRQIFTK